MTYCVKTGRKETMWSSIKQFPDQLIIYITRKNATHINLPLTVCLKATDRHTLHKSGVGQTQIRYVDIKKCNLIGQTCFTFPPHTISCHVSHRIMYSSTDEHLNTFYQLSGRRYLIRFPKHS